MLHATPAGHTLQGATCRGGKQDAYHCYDINLMCRCVQIRVRCVGLIDEQCTGRNRARRGLQSSGNLG